MPPRTRSKSLPQPPASQARHDTAESAMPAASPHASPRLARRKSTQVTPTRPSRATTNTPGDEQANGRASSRKRVRLSAPEPHDSDSEFDWEGGLDDIESDWPIDEADDSDGGDIVSDYDDDDDDDCDVGSTSDDSSTHEDFDVDFDLCDVDLADILDGGKALSALGGVPGQGNASISDEVMATLADISMQVLAAAQFLGLDAHSAKLQQNLALVALAAMPADKRRCQLEMWLELYDALPHEDRKAALARAQDLGETPEAAESEGQHDALAQMRRAALKQWRDSLPPEQFEEFIHKMKQRQRDRITAMPPDERNEFLRDRSQRRSQRIATMTPQEREERKKRRRQRIADMTPEDRAEHMERRRKRLADMPPEEREAYRMKRNERARQRLSSLTPEQRAERRRSLNERNRQRLAAMGPEERQERRRRQRERRKQRIEAMSPEEREAFLRRQNEMVRRWRDSLPPEERKEFIRRVNKRQQERIARMTPEERAERRRRMNDRHKQRLAAMSPEEREAYQRKKREDERRYKANMSPEQRERRRLSVNASNARSAARRRLLYEQYPELREEARRKARENYNRKKQNAVLGSFSVSFQ
ncbi:hypothetical protein HK105_202497 [Polyrhizophydium stewartii]|uniref:Uncharacterized protein n=1 Tax=Polyrhizophydium stewartii TaxID=2732419 RepID=A0ABR4NEZ3_9FUNG